MRTPIIAAAMTIVAIFAFDPAIAKEAKSAQERIGPNSEGGLPA